MLWDETCSNTIAIRLWFGLQALAVTEVVVAEIVHTVTECSLVASFKFKGAHLPEARPSTQFPRRFCSIKVCRHDMHCQVFGTIQGIAYLRVSFRSAVKHTEGVR